MIQFIIIIFVTTLFHFLPIKSQLIQNEHSILNSDNSLKFTKINQCEDYIQMISIFVKENPQALIDSLLQPYIRCSSSSIQDISNEDCCQNIQNAEFSLIEWTNILHGDNELEFLYVPTLLQGVCHPKECSGEDLEKNKEFILSLLRQSGYDKLIMGGITKVEIPKQNSGNSTSGNATETQSVEKIFGDSFTPFKIKSTKQKRNIDDHITLFIIFLILFSVPLILCIAYNIAKQYKRNSKLNFLQIFDYKSHIQKFIPHSKGMRKGPLDIFNLLRVIGVILVVLIHQFQNQNLASNYHEVAEESHSPFILLIYFSFEAVDMFLFMGGFFQAISMLPQKKIQKMSEGKLLGFVNVLKSLFYRFLRVWPALLVNVLIFTQVYYYLGTGPLWSMQEGEIESCDDYMYSNLLFIDNLGSEYTWKCFGHSWYLSVDFQLYIFCTLAVFVISKHQLTGTILLWVTLIITFQYNAVFLISNEILALDIADIAKFEQFTEETTYYEVGMHFYRKPWARAPVFIMGLLFGKSYVNKEFAFGNLFTNFMQKNTLIQKLSLVIATGILAFLIYFPLPLLSDPFAYSTTIQSIYFLILPILTMVSIMIFVSIIIVMYNSGKNQSLVNFISSRFIAVFAKISFMIYLTHLMVIKYRLFSQTQLLPWKVESMLGQYIINFLLSIIVATYLHLYIECPIGALTVWIQSPSQQVKKISNIKKEEIKEDSMVLPSSQIILEQQMQNKRTKNELVLIVESEKSQDDVIQQNKSDEKYNQNAKSEENVINIKLQQQKQQQQQFTENQQQIISQQICQENQNFVKKQQNQKHLFHKIVKQKITKHIFPLIMICIILGILLPLIFVNKDVNITKTPSGEKSQQPSFFEKTCFPNCASCSGQNYNQCNSCIKPFQFHAHTGTCTYPDVLRTQNSIEFVKQILYSSISNTGRILKNQIKCPSNNQTPEYYVKYGKYAQKWVISFSSMERWQDDVNVQLPDILPFQKGFFKFDKAENPNFYQYNYLNILNCFGSDSDRKDQMIEDIFEEIAKNFDFNIVRSIIITSTDQTGYNLALEYGSNNKLQNLISKLFNQQPDIYLILDGIPNNKNSNNLIENLQIPTFFITGDRHMSNYKSTCLQEEQTAEQQKQLQIFEQNQQIIIKKSQQPGNILWKPPCFLEEQYLNMETFTKVQINGLPVNYYLEQWSNYKLKFQKGEQLKKPLITGQNLILENQNDCKIIYEPDNNSYCFKDVYIQHIRTDFDENFQQEKEIYNKQQWETFKSYQLADEMGAKCANGIPPSTHFRQGIKRQRWLIHMKGQGWALEWLGRTVYEDLQGRYKAAETYTKNKEQSYPDFSRSPFSDYNRADIVYCDPGTMRQGYSEEPIEIEGKKFWFRGHNNTIAQFDTLIQSFDLANSKEVVLFGASSGGPSATIYANILQEMLHKINPYVKVKLITEGGMFLDAKNGYSEEMTFSNSFLKGFYQFSNRGKSFPPNTECVADQIPGEEWKCLFIQYAQKYVDVKIPTLIINSGYDFSQVNRVKKIYCYGFSADQGGEKIDFFNIGATCDADDMKIIETFRTELYKQLKGMKEDQPTLSAWVPSCSSHNFLNYQFNPNWQVPEDSGNTLYKVTKEFLDDDQVVFLLDDVPYPQNTACANTSP